MGSACRLLPLRCIHCIEVRDELAATTYFKSVYSSQMTDEEHIKRHLEICQLVYERLVAEGEWPWHDSRFSQDLLESEDTTFDI